MGNFIKYLFLIVLLGGSGYVVYQHPDVLQKLQLTSINNEVAPVTLTSAKSQKTSEQPIGLDRRTTPSTTTATTTPESASDPAPSSAPAAPAPIAAATPEPPQVDPAEVAAKEREERRRSAAIRKEATLKNPPLEIMTRGGRVYTGVKISMVLPDGIFIKHSEGGTRVLYSDMSPDLQLAFGYDKEEVALQAKEAKAKTASVPPAKTASPGR